MSEEQDLRTFRAPRIDVRVEKQYILSVAGDELGRFREVDEMCGMKELTGPKGTVILDCPDKLTEVLATLFATGESESFKASVMKASPSIIAAMQEAVDKAKAEREEDARGDIAGRPDGLKREPVDAPEPTERE